MLESLKVKNMALIENCELEFSEGLNILTGETGAGKSILLGSVNLALGQRIEGNVIRNGAQEASVELVFTNDEVTAGILKSLALPWDDDVIIISRKITPAKSLYRINGETVVARQVKELASKLMDIHGQHEHQSLLDTAKQRDMIDAYGGADIDACLKRIALITTEYNELKAQYEDALSKADGRDREISLLEYEVNEIEEACLIPGEDEELEEAYKRMASSEKLTQAAGEAMRFVSSESGEDAGSLISHALQAMSRIVSIDESAAELEASLKQAEEYLGDFSLGISKYIDNLEFDPQEFDTTEKRLDTINGLKAKFGRTVNDVLAYCEEKTAELERLKNLDEYLEGLNGALNSKKTEYVSEAQKLTGLRKKSASDFSKALTDTLLGLNFLDVRFEVSFASDYEKISKTGSDELEFMISTNPGETVKPVKNVASGGELSRIMLGIKTILADKDDIDSLIFDEIDSGISGVTAREVGKKLSDLSQKHQVISITHLAQIAAMADAHYIIEKGVIDGKTTTTINKASKEAEINELARLLGGDSGSEAARNNAIELKEAAKAYKE